jgi:hypothetical protein
MPLHMSIVRSGGTIELYWSNAGTNSNYVYALESNNSLSGTDWTPLANVPWPLRTNHWTLSPSNTVKRFFRVRAEEFDPQANRGQISAGAPR